MFKFHLLDPIRMREAETNTHTHTNYIVDDLLNLNALAAKRDFRGGGRNEMKT